MDFNTIRDAMKFFNWELIGAVAVLTTAWTQYLKSRLPEILSVGILKIPIVDIVLWVSGFVFSYFIFDISGVKHTETVALFHGFAGTLFSLLGYEILKGTVLGLRSTGQIKNGGK